MIFLDPLVGDVFESRLGTFLLEFFLNAFDHGDSFRFGSKFFSHRGHKHRKRGDRQSNKISDYVNTPPFGFSAS
jgi:hypothetical protein